MTKIPSADQIKRQLCERLFRGPLIQNNARGEYVEQMVDSCLSSDWTHCAGDWAGWDFERVDGVRLQVKQSAALQTWGIAKRPASFSIAPASGYYINGTEWIAKASRPAHLYLFAWHGITDGTADHTNPRQWRFFVVPEPSLPSGTKSISIRALERIEKPVGISAISEEVDRLSSGLKLAGI
jgi:hypothetical protein